MAPATPRKVVVVRQRVVPPAERVTARRQTAVAVLGQAPALAAVEQVLVLVVGLAVAQVERVPAVEPEQALLRLL